MNQEIPSPRLPHESETVKDYVAPCAGRALEFVGDGQKRREDPKHVAKRVAPLLEECRTKCRIREWCLSLAEDQEYPVGVWGGEYFYVHEDDKQNGPTGKQTVVRHQLKNISELTRRTA